MDASSHTITQILHRSQLPQLLGEGDEIPASGWAIVSDVNVYKDGQMVGLYVQLAVGRDGISTLTFSHG